MCVVLDGTCMYVTPSHAEHVTHAYKSTPSLVPTADCQMNIAVAKCR
jgi:hypothetical protein